MAENPGQLYWQVSRVDRMYSIDVEILIITAIFNEIIRFYYTNNFLASQPKRNNFNETSHLQLNTLHVDVSAKGYNSQVSTQKPSLIMNHIVCKRVSCLREKKKLNVHWRSTCVTFYLFISLMKQPVCAHKVTGNMVSSATNEST